MVNEKTNSLYLFIYNNMVYVPTRGKVVGTVKDGQFYITNAAYQLIDPIYITELDKDAIVRALEKVKQTGNPILSEQEVKEYYVNLRSRSKNPILRATKARSGSYLNKNSKAYIVSFNDGNIRLYCETELLSDFPPHTSLELIVEKILQDHKISKMYQQSIN